MDDIVIKYLPKVENYNPTLDGTNKGVVVDAEATSPFPETAVLIQVTFIEFWFTDDFEITKIGDPIIMYNDPGGPIPEEITKLTGITDKMVRGHTLDYQTVHEVFTGAEVVIAHNAKFDRKLIERHVLIPNLIWGCSMYDIDWKAKFINSRALDYLAFRCGFWFKGHDATEDCFALIHVLSHNGYFRELMERVFTDTYKVIIRESEFEEKNVLKGMHFYWDPENKYWFKTGVTEADFDVIKEELKKLTKYSASKKYEDVSLRYKD